MTTIFELGRRCCFYHDRDHDFRLLVGASGYCYVAQLSDRGQVLRATERQPTIGGSGQGATLLCPSRADLDDPNTYANLLRKIGHRQVKIAIDA